MAEQLLEIVNGKVQVWNRTLQAEADIESLRDYLLTPQALYIPNMPRHTAALYINPDKTQVKILTELPPAVRTVRFRTYEDYETPREIEGLDQDEGTDLYVARLPMPYCYFLWSLGNTTDWNQPLLQYSQAFWRPTRLTNEDQKLWTALLPNVSSDGSICWGDVDSHGTQGFSKLDRLTNEFFSAGSNPDYGWNMPTNYNTYLEWQNTGPTDFTSWSLWDAQARTFEDLIGQTQASLPRLDPTLFEYPRFATLGALAEWWNGLPEDHRTRLQRVVRLPETES